MPDQRGHDLELLVKLLVRVRGRDLDGDGGGGVAGCGAEAALEDLAEAAAAQLLARCDL